jgi:multiple sugar transport system permease protein
MKSGEKMTRRKLTKAAIPYLLISPGLILMALIVGYPIVRSFIMSFFHYILWQPNNIKFIGLENYKSAFGDTEFIQSILNTLFWVVFGVFFQFFFGLLLALILNCNFKARGVFRAVMLIPWVTPGVLIGILWRWMYDGNNGLINALLTALGLINQNIPFLAQKSTSLPSATLTIIWQGIPFFALMLMASLQSIPDENIEAAKIDGASSIKIFQHIMLPHLMPTIIVTIILRIIWVANSIDILYSLTEGGPGYSSMTLALYTFVKAQGSLDFGYASMLSIYLAIMIFALIFLFIALLGKRGKEVLSK